MANNNLYVAKIVGSTSVDGPGLRNALYLAGCNLRCKGCHNKEWWDINKGEVQTIDEVFSELNQDDFNISILGGEPLLQYHSLLSLCKLIKEKTDKTIWLWTGYTIDHLQIFFGDILLYVDVVIDGQYDERLKKSNLRFRGSENQRIFSINHTDTIDIIDITEFYN